MSTPVRFVDTNVLLYAISRDREERDKAKQPDRSQGGRDGVGERDPLLAHRDRDYEVIRAHCALQTKPLF